MWHPHEIIQTTIISLSAPAAPILALIAVDPAPITTAVMFAFISLAGVLASVLFVQKKITEDTKREIRTGFQQYKKSLEREVNGWP